MTRLLMITNSSSGGGAEKVFNSLVEGFKGEGSLSASHLYLQGESSHKLWKLFAIFKFIWVLIRLRPDVVQSHLLFPNMLNVVLSRVFRYKSQIVCHSSFERFKNTKLEKVIRALYRGAHSIICVSKEMANQAKVFLDKADGIETIYNPHLLATYEELSQQHYEKYFDNYFIVVGRLIKSKQVKSIIEVLRQVDETENLLIVGNGPEYEPLSNYVNRLDLTHRVKFTGLLSNPYPYIKNAKAMILASETEGFPNCLVEAFALGVPVITSNCKTGPAELLGVSYEDTELRRVYKNSFIYPVNDVGALKKSIEDFNSLHTDLEGLKLAVAALNIDNVVKQYIESIKLTLTTKS
ncbi:glycosyltransferase [Pseudoalteromonas umbrosa]|uniref:glycosyltransferase n=1 Tax=Pseudoalteromonas umbrosa TaxID=3048489 RepID=UPI0024C2BC65|nr:glycosyltransferase [Pseudoalteromonas sp. B95]MDK1289585.1 glycosyltransferase [Pseudoalteromonas sp. B95]